MNKPSTPIDQSSYFLKSGQLLKLMSALFLIGSLFACAATPTQQSSSGPAVQPDSDKGLAGAAAMYNTRNYPGAIREFDAVIANKGASANNRRLAHLGKAMVYLGSDEKWHSMANAKMSLVSAGQVAPKDGEDFNVETDMLMDAVSAVIGTESKYAVLMSKSSHSGQENAKLRQELDEVKAEREELLEEQKVLNEALEKLKKLTLGN